MRQRILVVIISCCLWAGTQAQTATDWQQDLRWLQQTVHTKYSNLFYNIPVADWDKAVDALYADIPRLNNNQVLAGFIQLVALFHIGHTQMNTFRLHGSNSGMLLHRYPFQLYWFSDGLYIKRAHKDYTDAVGGKIMRIGNMSATEAFKAIRPLVSFENEQGYLSNGVAFLSIPEFIQTQGIYPSDTEVPITYIKNGKETTTIFKAGADNNIFSPTGLLIPKDWVDAATASPSPLWRKEESAFRYMELLPGTATLYVRHSATMDDGDKTVAAFFNNMSAYIEKNNVEKLVLDIRLNGGGNNYLNKSIITNIIASKKINKSGKFFCIIGRRTFSAAQNLVNELEKYTEVIFVGEPTSENVNFYGDTKTEILPNSNIAVNLSWLWWQNLDPRDKRKATAPQIATDMRFEDYVTGNDPAMNVIQQYDQMKAFMPVFSELADAGKTNEALQMAKKYLADPVNRYFIASIENQVNEAGYKMLKTQPQVANTYFGINIQLFPQSANAYDSYAESFMAMGKMEEAIRYYEMAIAKDQPGGATAENARNMIAKIRAGK